MKRTFTSLVLGLALLVGGESHAVGQTLTSAHAARDRRDYPTAVREFRLLADKGDAEAQSILGYLYFAGEGVQQSYREARRWYSLAAEQNNEVAQYALGRMYEEGLGVIQDYREAERWYRSAAEQGNWWSQNELGLMYRNGQGVTQDYVYAHMWLNIAASSGDTGMVRDRDSVAKKMTAAQIARAQELARQCVAKNFKGC